MAGKRVAASYERLVVELESLEQGGREEEEHFPGARAFSGLNTTYLNV